MSKVLVYNISVDDTISKQLYAVANASDLITASFSKLQKQCTSLNASLGGVADKVAGLHKNIKSLGQQQNIINNSSTKELKSFGDEISKTESKILSLEKVSKSFKSLGANISSIGTKKVSKKRKGLKKSKGFSLGKISGVVESVTGAVESIRGSVDAVSEFNTSTLLEADAYKQKKSAPKADVASGAADSGGSDEAVGPITATFDKVAGAVGTSLAPAIETAKGKFFDMYSVVGTSLAPVLETVSGALETVSGVLGALSMVIEVVSLVTEVWTAIQWLYNAAMAANPVVLIVLGIIALIAAIVAVATMTEGWGKTWDNIVKFMSLGFDLFLQGIEIGWLYVKGFFADGFDEIAKGWYKLQSLWDEEGANEGLAKIDADSKKRAEELAKAKQKADELASEMSNMKVWEVKIKEDEETSKDGISQPKIPGLKPKAVSSMAQNPAVNQTTESVSSGGTRNSQITINLGKMIENIVFQGGVSENRFDLERQLEESLLRVLYSAQSVG